MWCRSLRSVPGGPLRHDQITPSLFSSLQPALTIQVRHATHGVQGRANGAKNGAGKRLGAKKTGDEYVIPGNIIFRQRGTNWHPGHNVGMGRDHTIYAAETGYVKYYRDPLLHPKRRYIGVTFERHESLPPNRAVPRQRRLGMLAVPRSHAAEEQAVVDNGAGDLGIVLPNSADQSFSVAQTQAPSRAPASSTTASAALSRKQQRHLSSSGRVPVQNIRMGTDYSYRESNFEIGRSADRAGVKVKEFVPGDRFAAWRKRRERRKLAELSKSVKKKKEKKGKMKGRPGKPESS